MKVFRKDCAHLVYMTICSIRTCLLLPIHVSGRVIQLILHWHMLVTSYTVIWIVVK